MNIPEEKIRNILAAHFGDIPTGDLSINKVLRLDSDQFYYLIFVFHTGAQKDKLVIVNDSEFEIAETAETILERNLTKPGAVLDAEQSGAKSQLVWTPCRISFSPFYPFWKVESGVEIFYADENNNIYKSIPEGRRG